jgi:hypothetical protein
LDSSSICFQPEGQLLGEVDNYILHNILDIAAELAQLFICEFEAGVVVAVFVVVAGAAFCNLQESLTDRLQDLHYFFTLYRHLRR